MKGLGYWESPDLLQEPLGYAIFEQPRPCAAFEVVEEQALSDEYVTLCKELASRRPAD